MTTDRPSLFGRLRRRRAGAAADDVHRLGYRWVIEGPIEVVFDTLVRGTEFPDWWRPVFLEAHSDDPEPVVGARVRFRVRGRLPYGLDWVVTLRRLERPHLIENETVVVLGGRLRLSGPVRFRLTQQGDRVEVINEQEMRSERRLPRPIRAVWQRVFSNNHDWAMAKGGIGLQRAVRERLAGNVRASASGTVGAGAEPGERAAAEEVARSGGHAASGEGAQ